MIVLLVKYWRAFLCVACFKLPPNNNNFLTVTQNVNIYVAKVKIQLDDLNLPVQLAGYAIF